MGVVVGHLFAVQLDGTLAAVANAEQGLDDVGALGPHQPGHPEDLPLVQVEGDVLDGGLVFRRQVLDLEDHLFRLVGLLREALGELATDHHADDLIHGHALERLGRHPLAIPQYGDLVTELGIVGERLGDLDHLHLGDGEGTDLDPRVYVDVQLVEDMLGVLIHLAVVDEQSLGGIATEPHVVHHGALQHQVQLLMHHGDTVLQRLLGGGEVDLLPLEEDLALILLVNAEQALEQRRFPCPVLAHQRMHRMRTDP